MAEHTFHLYAHAACGSRWWQVDQEEVNHVCPTMVPTSAPVVKITSCALGGPSPAGEPGDDYIDCWAPRELQAALGNDDLHLVTFSIDSKTGVTIAVQAGTQDEIIATAKLALRAVTSAVLQDLEFTAVGTRRVEVIP